MELMSVAATVSGLAYYCLCLWSAAEFLRDPEGAGGATKFSPAVSILKPLKGTDPEMYASFRSHCVNSKLFSASAMPTIPRVNWSSGSRANFPKGRFIW
jgi:hypothetical protein